jgi:hypothetical protein
MRVLLDYYKASKPESYKKLLKLLDSMDKQEAERLLLPASTAAERVRSGQPLNLP